VLTLHSLLLGGTSRALWVPHFKFIFSGRLTECCLHVHSLLFLPTIWYWFDVIWRLLLQIPIFVSCSDGPWMEAILSDTSHLINSIWKLLFCGDYTFVAVPVVRCWLFCWEGVEGTFVLYISSNLGNFDFIYFIGTLKEVTLWTLFGIYYSDWMTYLWKRWYRGYDDYFDGRFTGGRSCVPVFSQWAVTYTVWYIVHRPCLDHRWPRYSSV
jgi:hypothetical protein